MEVGSWKLEVGRKGERGRGDVVGALIIPRLLDRERIRE